MPPSLDSIRKTVEEIKRRATNFVCGGHDAPRLVIMLPGETAHEAVFRAYDGEPPVRIFDGKPVPLIIMRGVNPDGSTAAPVRIAPAGGEYVKHFNEEDN